MFVGYSQKSWLKAVVLPYFFIREISKGKSLKSLIWGF